MLQPSLGEMHNDCAKNTQLFTDYQRALAGAGAMRMTDVPEPRVTQTFVQVILS